MVLSFLAVCMAEWAQIARQEDVCVGRSQVRLEMLPDHDESELVQAAEHGQGQGKRR